MKKYIVISFVVHFLLLINLVLTAVQAQQRQADADARDVKPKAIEAQEVTMLPSKDGDIPVAKPEERKEPTCKYWYGGIGIVQDYRTNVVTQVFKGYVADRSGIVVGDTIIGNTENDITGDPGTNIVLTIKKLDGTVIKAPLTREKVCYVDS